ncbi:hypothetical protein [Methanobrevibacter sp.]
MNQDNFDTWINAIKEHINMLDNLINDRRMLKDMIETHLREFFDYDDIEYNRDFSKITLTFKPKHHVIINPENLVGLLMDFEVIPAYDDNAERIIQIHVYPLGMEEVME